ncbi:hypothetical protein [Aeromonas allosaccharophila]|uniref:hypothetical protein n=1 Tax=Aeromonas allosaccharophila TaxID=656 RepID=UPI002ADFEC07|nr:hypothetical protein [Aeromonas allosaccharophila]
MSWLTPWGLGAMEDVKDRDGLAIRASLPSICDNRLMGKGSLAGAEADQPGLALRPPSA